MAFILFFFFFQAEDGIRDLIVTGVQTCALPISGTQAMAASDNLMSEWKLREEMCEIGRASCRESVDLGGRRIIKKKKKKKISKNKKIKKKIKRNNKNTSN